MEVRSEGQRGIGLRMRYWWKQAKADKMEKEAAVFNLSSITLAWRMVYCFSLLPEWSVSSSNRCPGRLAHYGDWILSSIHTDGPTYRKCIQSFGLRADKTRWPTKTHRYIIYMNSSLLFSSSSFQQQQNIVICIIPFWVLFYHYSAH